LGRNQPTKLVSKLLLVEAIRYLTTVLWWLLKHLAKHFNGLSQISEHYCWLCLRHGTADLIVATVKERGFSKTYISTYCLRRLQTSFSDACNQQRRCCKMIQENISKLEGMKFIPFMGARRVETRLVALQF